MREGFIIAENARDLKGLCGVVTHHLAFNNPYKQLLSEPKQSLVYEHVSGDSWEHQVVLEKVIVPEPDGNYPRQSWMATIRAVRRAARGLRDIWNYANFLEAIGDANHPEHDELLESIGGSFNPEQFDSEAVNQALRRIR